ncbi:MAG: VanW family protein [Candidatus Aminicenantaceae bacterium]
MKRILNRLIPGALRFRLRVAWIRIRDTVTGTRFRFARSSTDKIAQARAFTERITITQRINISDWAENKKHNLRLATATFQDLPFEPGEVYSYWHYVGNPTEKAGYKVGINIIANKLDFDVGGGLCQLSGLLYHLALTAGLEIVERHPHSVDLYTEETRYTPLGADSTTAYGYKDLRLRNNLEFPICFRFRIEEKSLIGSLCAPQAIKEYELDFPLEIRDGIEVVQTLRKTESGEFETICSQTYIIADHDQTI